MTHTPTLRLLSLALVASLAGQATPAAKTPRRGATPTPPKPPVSVVIEDPTDLTPATVTAGKATYRDGSERNYYGFIPRVPFQSGRVYRLVLVPGAPFALELPLGEGVRAASCDRQWFKAEGDESSNRLMVSAMAAEGVEAKRSFLQVESTSGILYSFALEVGSPTLTPAAGLSIYMEGTDKEASYRKAAMAQAGAQTVAFQGELERRMRGEFNRWKAETLASYSSTYKVEQDGIKLDKVLSNSVQTYLYTRNLSEIPTVKLVNRDKQEEVLDFEHDNGVFVVNRVLRPGERFILAAGKSKATVRVD